MICNNCGANIENGANVCPSCGAPVNAPVSQPQNGYTAPAQRTVVIPPPNLGQNKTYTVKKGKGGGWITFAKVLLWFSFATIVLMGIILGITVMSAGSLASIANQAAGDIIVPAISGAAAVIAGIFIMIGGVILAFVSVCYGFILLDACTNLISINDNLAELITITADSKNTAERINATVYEILRK